LTGYDAASDLSGLGMKRREFITLIGGAAALPLAVSAQQRTGPVVGFLGTGLDARQNWLAAFRAGLGGEGFVERTCGWSIALTMAGPRDCRNLPMV
jgi:hypothetical protein